MEAIEEEAADKKEGEEIYLVVMDKGEKLPTDMDVELDGYSVDNPYHAEKEETKESKDTESSNVTASVNNIIEKNDVAPVPEKTIEDPSSRVLDIAKPVDNYLVGMTDMAINAQTIDYKEFMTLDGSADLGYKHHNVRQLGAVDNNYSFMTRQQGTMDAGTELDIMLKIVQQSLTLAGGPKKYYIAPKKKDYNMRYQNQPELLCDVGVVEMLQNIKTELLDGCLLYTSPSPRDGLLSRMPSSA